MNGSYQGGDKGTYQGSDEVAYQVGRGVLSEENEGYSIIRGERIKIPFRGAKGEYFTLASLEGE